MAYLFPWKDPKNRLDFAVIRRPIDALVRSVEAQVQRAWPTDLGGAGGRQLPFAWMLKTARWTHNATRYLLADTPPDAARRLEFTVAARPLNRVILDMVFNVVFILDDYPCRLCSYVLAGLRQHRGNDDHYLQRFSGDPAWKDWLSRLRGTFENRDALEAEWRRWCPGAPDRFPHPGAMLRRQRDDWRDRGARDFLEYLNREYYRSLSSAAHSQWFGLAASVAQPLRIESGEDTQEEFARKEKSDLLVQQVIFILCLVTELLTFGRLDGAAGAAYAWGILSEYSGWAREAYESRYRRRLVP